MRKSVLLSLSALTAIVVAGSAERASACGSEPYLGDVCYTAAIYCPRGFQEARGQLLSVNQYQALFSLLGTNYGGDGRINFGLPDLRGRVAVGIGQGPGLSDIVQGTMFGMEEVRLTTNQMAPHIHPASFAGTAPTAAGKVELPVNGAVTGQTLDGNASLPFSAQADLPVSASAKIGSTSTTGRTQNIGQNVSLASAANTSGAVYVPPGTSTVVVGPANGVTGTASGVVSGSATGPLTGVSVSNGAVMGKASGDVSLPLNISSLTIGSNPTANLPVGVRDPSTALRACVSVEDALYPPRP